MKCCIWLLLTAFWTCATCPKFYKHKVKSSMPVMVVAVILILVTWRALDQYALASFNTSSVRDAISFSKYSTYLSHRQVMSTYLDTAVLTYRPNTDVSYKLQLMHIGTIVYQMTLNNNLRHRHKAEHSISTTRCYTKYIFMLCIWYQPQQI